MADRYPLIANSRVDQIQELASGDNIDLTGNNIVGVVGVNASGIITATSFVGDVTGNASGLTNTPDITVRNITGVAATFSGVVTYEDVTNVDSVGIVTAGTGVRVTDGGLVVTAGVSTFGTGVRVTDGGLVVTAGVSTFTKAADFNGALKESGNVTANTADQYPVDLLNGNVYYFSTNGTGSGTVDITYNSGNNVNTFLDTGDNVAISVIAKPNSAGYITGVKIDNVLVTSEWSSDSAVAPSSANTGAYDLYSINILKTGSSAYICLCSRTKFD